MAIEITADEAKLLARALHAYGTSVGDSARRLPLRTQDATTERYDLLDEAAKYHERARELERQVADEIERAQDNSLKEP